jgi:hypothetical protein
VGRWFCGSLASLSLSLSLSVHSSPVMKLLVPSIGSMTHRYSPAGQAPPPAPATRGSVIPPSSPNTACSGASRPISARAAASACRSATVTGEASALASTGSEDRK